MSSGLKKKKNDFSIQIAAVIIFARNSGLGIPFVEHLLPENGWTCKDRPNFLLKKVSIEKIKHNCKIIHSLVRSESKNANIVLRRYL